MFHRLNRPDPLHATQINVSIKPAEDCSYETETFANLLTQSASTKQTKYLIIKR